MKTGIIYSKKSLNHDTGDGHPENKFRIQSILEKLKKFDSTELAWSEPKNLMKYCLVRHITFIT